MVAELELPAVDRQMPESTSSAGRGRIPLRLWVMAAILAAFWVFEFTIYSTEMAMFPRFITRMLVLLLLLVTFLGWWLTNRHLLWRDRLLGLVLLIAGTTVTSLLADQSARMIVVMAGLPRLFTAWTAWLLISRSWRLATQRAGVLAATFLVLGYFTLVRWDGLDGAQRAKLSWRWSPTPEQLFLATTATKAAPAKSASETPVADVSTSAANEATKPWKLQPGDWPDFFSNHLSSNSTSIEASDDWSKEPPQLVWRRRVGPAWSSMIIVDDHLVTQEQRGQTEAVVCYSAASGEEIWAHTEPGRFEEPLSGPGPRATPAFSSQHIYAIGARGKLVCLKATTGELVWSRDLLTEAEAAVPQWGFSVSPLALDDLVIVFAGGKTKQSLAAYRADTGQPVWGRAAGDQSYSSPQLITLAGQRQIVMHDSFGVHAVSVESGETLWEQLGGAVGAAPMLQPHVITDGELLTAAGDGIALLDVKSDRGKWMLAKRWETNSLKPGFNDFVVHDGHIFGLDDGILCCLDLQTGRRLWKKGRFGHGQLLLVPSISRLIVVSETGEVALVAARPERLEELGRFQAIEGKSWNHPVLAHGYLFVRNGVEMACYRLPVRRQLTSAP